MSIEIFFLFALFLLLLSVTIGWCKELYVLRRMLLCVFYTIRLNPFRLSAILQAIDIPQFSKTIIGLVNLFILLQI